MKHIHFIGICGVAMSALAIAFAKKGYVVTGSDAGFYPPVSTNLLKNKISFYPGWHPEKMIYQGTPDLVIVGNVAGSNNPEWLFVQENQIPYLSYPEAIAEYFLGENSLVCAGTYGKTTSSTLLAWILKNANFDPSYMFGGVAVNDLDSAAISDARKYSVLEGDEYKTSSWDNRPKFALYAPTHLLLTSVSWDHADVYPTEQSYFDAFKTLVASIPASGLLVACSEGKNMDKVLSENSCRVVMYGKSDNADYVYKNETQTANGLSFDIFTGNETYHVTTPILGEYNVENMVGCFALAKEIGIAPHIILESFASFKGLKRRLEKRLEGDITVIDDIAHSPAKAQSLLATLQKIYTGKIIAVFEPNTGNRQKEAIPQYEQAFAAADMVIIPRLTKLKVDPRDPNKHLDGQELSQIISQSHPDVKYIDDDKELVKFLVQNAKKGSCIAFLGSHGFRGMIEETVTCLRQQSQP